MRIVWKLLRQHLSPSQLGGFILASLLGLLVVLTALQLYADVLPLFAPHSGLVQKDYVVISKKISTLGSFIGKDNTFSQREIDQLGRQPFVSRLGEFQASQFKVRAGVGMSGTSVHFETELFFESVPQEFVDVESNDWHYVPGMDEIPIVVPRNYLNLYNFGFAQTRNLPKISEGLLEMVRLDITVYGNGRTGLFKGKVVGFSERLNTILVPEDFMQWANSEYALVARVAPSRLIVELDNPTDEAIVAYFRDKGYEMETDRLEAGKTTWLLKVVVGVVAVVGGVICLLAFYLLMLSIFLLLQKNSAKIANLLLIGYSPKQAARPYQLLVVGLNATIWLLAAGGLVLVRWGYIGLLGQLLPDLPSASVIPVLVVGAAIMTVVSLLNVYAIRRKVNAIWENKL